MGTYMLTKTCLVIFLVLNAVLNEAISFKGFYGIKTNDHPKSSCHEIASIISARQCLATCGIQIDTIVMISHDKSTKTCLCCNDINGSDIIGSNWKTYVPPPCAEGYTTYNLTSHQICLKYFPILSTYSSARFNCYAEGGDLIKIDSQEKFNIFKNHHEPIANNEIINVWVQGEKIDGQWWFDDGTLIPNVCPISMSNQSTEVHFRARGYNSFTCVDAPNSGPFYYSCEYHRLLSIRN